VVGWLVGWLVGWFRDHEEDAKKKREQHKSRFEKCNYYFPLLANYYIKVQLVGYWLVIGW
jgi:hypothetical protein